MTTLIIGGGLCGLALADAMEARGDPYLLVEARARFGGRIMTQSHDTAAFDMGPAWFWPGQPRIAALIDRLGLCRFDQFAQGTLTYENERGEVSRGRGFSSMEGSWRLQGGLCALTNALAARIPDANKRLNSNVTAVTRTKGRVAVTLSQGDTLYGTQVVLALPLRIAAQMRFTPALAGDVMEHLRDTPTWMAGQAKAVAVYDTPFWRDDGLSGDAMSRRGPMVEIHDASPASGGPYALFGFIGVPPKSRRNEQALRLHVITQLTRLFGPKAAEPAALFIKDWALDPHTATPQDAEPLYAHPTYGLPAQMTQLWEGTLHIAGTEAAPEFGGYIEGALEAAQNVLQGFAPPEQEPQNAR